jgi:hypothetical protein
VTNTEWNGIIKIDNGISENVEESCMIQKIYGLRKVKLKIK